MRLSLCLCLLYFLVAAPEAALSSPDGRSLHEAVQLLERFVGGDQWRPVHSRSKRDPDDDDDRDANRGVTNLDIRDAILQLLSVVRDGNKKLIQNDKTNAEMTSAILQKLNSASGSGTESVERKIDNISTFLLRMNTKMDEINRKLSRTFSVAPTAGRAPASDALSTLAQESFDILTLLPTYIDNTKDAIASLSKDTKDHFQHLETLLIDGDQSNRSLAMVLMSTEASILNASSELKEIVIESGHMAESLFERVNDGYKDLMLEMKGMANVEKVLLTTADSVIEMKRKMEFGVQQIMQKVDDLSKASGMKLDQNLKDQFADITRTILSNQTEALKNLTQKMEKEIGQVWRQMGITYMQVSNSISMLEKMKAFTEGYVNKTGNNLGTMEGQVSGLTDRMVDVDQNLNYILGQLSLVVQEFNQVKTGLGEAMSGLGDELDQIREYKVKGDASAATPDN